MIDGADMGVFASRGQARTLALTLRLAEAEFLSSIRGDGPVVLFDDAFSEMDSSRRYRLLEKATRYEQVLITTTDLNQVNDFFWGWRQLSLHIKRTDLALGSEWKHFRISCVESGR
ncbi:MAG: hypothetical protein CM1200mP22_08600 [Dehalococcoidia bacterium]|nr:MAG: hypothetical protein CM1200mP22_08600 [Dehalococcoidia bacterium]